MKGLPELKVKRLRAVAEVALAELQELPGIGPFYETLILVRSSGHADLLAAGEPRVRACAARRYGLDGPERFAELAEAWRPFRTWATVLLRYADAREAA